MPNFGTLPESGHLTPFLFVLNDSNQYTFSISQRNICIHSVFDDMEKCFQGSQQVAVNWYFDTENECVADLAEIA